MIYMVFYRRKPEFSKNKNLCILGTYEHIIKAQKEAASLAKMLHSEKSMFKIWITRLEGEIEFGIER